MRKLIAVIFIMFICAASNAQLINYSKTISVPAKDSSVITLDCTNSSDLVFSTPDDSTSVRSIIDTTYRTALVQKWSDGTNAAGSSLAAGTYIVKDPALKKVRFVNLNAAAILIEIKYRCGN